MSTSIGTRQQSSNLRPILHHLNADSSWLLQLPRISEPSQDSTQDTEPQRTYYNILIDPWLQGSQVDVYAWFSRQWHAEPSHVRTVQEVCNLAQVTENAANASTTENVANNIDLVIVSHEFTDHCHQDTLLQVETSVPVLAAREAAKLVRSWKHFDTVIDLEPISAQRAHSTILPSYLNISRLQKPGDALYLHAAVIIAFASANASAEECVVYTPHGIYPDTAKALRSMRTDLRPLCLIHGLHDVWLTLTQQINLGGHNGLKVYRALGCKYWTSTHDEDKIGRGFISYVLNRKLISVADAMRKEASKTQHSDNEDVDFRNVPNGGKLILV